MTVRTNVLPLDRRSVTLTEVQWSTIRHALITMSRERSVAGNRTDADYYMRAYQTLAEASGLDPLFTTV